MTENDELLEMFENENWNDVDDKPPAIPTGEYHMKMIKLEAVVSAKKGTPGIALEGVIQAGPSAGKSVKVTVWKSKDAMWAFKAMFGKKGFDVIGPDGKANFKLVEGWEGIIKLTTKVKEDSDFPDYRIRPLSALK
jgi:hypothetical protein